MRLYEISTPKIEASYVGNLGMMEMMKFWQIASNKQKAVMKHLLNKGKNRLAAQLLQQVTKTKLMGKEFESFDHKYTIMRISELIETASDGATAAGSIASVDSPHLSPGKARGMKSYTGSPGQSGTKAPPQPKPKKQKPTDNALDMKTNIFGAAAPIKR